MAQDLQSFAGTLKQNVESGVLLPVEAYAQLADRATANFADIDGMMWGMTNILLGIDPNAIEVWKFGLAKQYSKQITSAKSLYYAGDDWLPYKHDPSKDDLSRKYRHSKIGDWKPEYWDDTPNQAYHSWYFVAVQYYDNLVYANAANVVHDPYFLEPYCGDDLKGLIGAINSVPFVGSGIASRLTFFGETSEQDFKLSQKAMELGNGMWWAFDTGPVKIPGSINDPGTWIRNNFQNPVGSTSPSSSQPPSRLVKVK